MRKMLGILLMGIMLVGCMSSGVQGEGIKVIEEKTQETPSQIPAQSPSQSPVPSELPVMSEEEKQEAALQEAVARLTLEEKVGQLLMVAIRKDAQGEPVTVMNEEMREAVTQYHVGGIILFSENVQTPDQLKKLIGDLQQTAKIPLFIGVDEEGGCVSRIGNQPQFNAQPFQEAFTLGETKMPSKAYDEAKRMGELLASLGFNMDFAPDADLFNEPANQVIGRRSFGRDAKTVMPMVMAFAKGLTEQGILPVVKHFPGHGCTKEDSHTGLAYVDKPLAQLEKEELRPFMAAIEGDVAGVMKGHLMVPAVDETYPASLSVKWQTYLCEKADVSSTLFITDALNMGAITTQYKSGEAAILAVEAGNDILLMPEDLEEAYRGILGAIEEGRLSEERIDVSVKKILSKKIAHNQRVLS